MPLQIKRDKYLRFLSWAFTNGLFLGILITYGRDVTKEGILSNMIYELNKLMPIPAYFWLQIMLFLVGVGSFIAETYLVWKEGWLVRIMTISIFLSSLSLIIGIALGVSVVVNIGVLLIFVGGITLLIIQNVKES